MKKLTIKKIAPVHSKDNTYIHPFFVRSLLDYFFSFSDLMIFFV